MEWTRGEKKFKACAGRWVAEQEGGKHRLAGALLGGAGLGLGLGFGLHSR